jgi:hypothetical protein
VRNLIDIGVINAKKCIKFELGVKDWGKIFLVQNLSEKEPLASYQKC